MIKTVLAIAATALLSANALANQQQAEGAISRAEQVTDQAGKTGFEWRDTRKLLKAAKKALATGDYDMAMTTANRAHRQSENALVQAGNAAN